MLQKKVVQVDGWGELHVIEPELGDVQPLLTEVQSGDGLFGLGLLKLCLHYPDGRKVFSEKVGIAKGKALMPLISECIEVCGFAGESDASRADDLPAG